MLTGEILSTKISRVSRCTLISDKWGHFLRGIFSGWGVFMAGEDGARIAFWTKRELINVEVLSGGIDGPTFRVPCAPSN